MLRFGKISEFDPAKMYARVTFTDDEIVSDWLQIIVTGALSTKEFRPMDINEQVACLMDENSEEGVILGATYNDSTNPSGGTKDKFRIKFADNSFVEYDRSSHEYEINVQGKVKITAATEVNVTANVANVEAPAINLTGAVSVEGTLDVSGNISTPATVSAATVAASSSITGPGVSVSGGNISASGSLEAAEVKEGSIRLGTHVHSGVETGGGNTGTPV